MKIAFIDTLGMCYDGDTLNRRGLGGSESAVIQVAKELVQIGFDVTVYNNCTTDDTAPGTYNGVVYCPLDAAKTTTETFDVCIVSRSVKPYLEQWPICTTARHKVLWMHDTFCEGDDQIEYLINVGRLNEIFTLSDWHTGYVTHCDHGFRRNYDILKNHIFMTRNGIGNMTSGWVDVRDKDPNLFVFNASVTKGMVPLVKRIWPKVKARIPQAQLKIIGGYYKFAEAAEPDLQQKDWASLTGVLDTEQNVHFTGIITQQEISDILRKASYMIYPVGLPETFGISTLEALAHNVPLITCQFGALEETAIDAASWKIKYPVEQNWSMQWLNEDSQCDMFVEAVVAAYNSKYVHQQKMYACNQVKDICTWDTIALQWKQHLFKKLGEFLPVNEYRAVTKINNRVRKVFNRRWMNAEEMQEPRNIQKSIGIITTVYNAENYIQKCILSVAQQDYDCYHMWIVDDASTDNTVKIARDTIAALPAEVRRNFSVIKNKRNVGALKNQYDMLKETRNDDIVMILDGDDWLVNDPNIFNMYNNLYHDGAQFTYGSCWSVVDNIPLVAQPYPPEIKETKQYRNYKFNWNMPYTHLRTFDPKLVDNLNAEEHLKIDGQWPKAGGDTALFYYLIENADPKAVVCVPDIVYNYNDANPLCDFRINGEEQNKTADKVISTKSPFTDGQYDLRPL